MSAKFVKFPQDSTTVKAVANPTCIFLYRYICIRCIRREYFMFIGAQNSHDHHYKFLFLELSLFTHWLGVTNSFKSMSKWVHLFENQKSPAKINDFTDTALQKHWISHRNVWWNGNNSIRSSISCDGPNGPKISL